ncbi:MAG: serine/threonine-protein kinase [Leptolyngbyaceae cyanobacterium bins.59]|nr:serine/threonine-protein kinase [Leptolyngbyaceae cyanobacterium bins.59]
MDAYCTRPGCPRPTNFFPDLDDAQTLKTVQQKYCTSCGMPLILVGRYLPTKLLGQGGFGTAFLAIDRYSPALRQCVVKQFQPAGDLNPTQLNLARSLFEREAEVLEQLGNPHPQIPDLYASFQLTAPDPRSGKSSDFFYLVQEFIDGQNLEDEMIDRGPLPESEVVQMLIEILKVLKFVHDNHSIHRDIKPSNIMRHRNGHFYLLDFGAVKQLTKAVGGNASTGIYSMGYAPPEQMASSAVFPSSDLYALAVTCITLLTGQTPDRLLDAYNNRWNWRPHAPQVSDRLADILDRMLLPAPNQRFQSAEEVLAALAPRKPATPPPRPAPAPPSATGYQPSAPTQAQAPPATVPPFLQTRSAQTAPPIVPAPAPAPIASPPPATPAPTPAPTPITRSSSSIPAFSILEILAGAAFTGFEGTLIAIALTSLLKPSLISGGLALLLLGGMVFAQSQRIIEKIDLLVLAGITLIILFFVPAMQLVNFQTTILVAGVAACLAVAATALFRLIYNLLVRIL